MEYKMRESVKALHFEYYYALVWTSLGREWSQNGPNDGTSYLAVRSPRCTPTIRIMTVRDRKLRGLLAPFQFLYPGPKILVFLFQLLDGFHQKSSHTAIVN